MEIPFDKQDIDNMTISSCDSFLTEREHDDQRFEILRSVSRGNIMEIDKTTKCTMMWFATYLEARIAFHYYESLGNSAALLSELDSDEYVLWINQPWKSAV